MHKIQMNESIENYPQRLNWVLFRDILMGLSVIVAAAAVILIIEYSVSGAKASTLASILIGPGLMVSAILFIFSFNANKKFENWRELVYTNITESIYEKTGYRIHETSVDLLHGIHFNSGVSMRAVAEGSYKGNRDDVDDDCAHVFFHREAGELYYELDKIKKH